MFSVISTYTSLNRVSYLESIVYKFELQEADVQLKYFCKSFDCYSKELERLVRVRRINVFINILYYIPSTLHLDNILVKSHEKHPLNWAFSEIRFVVQYCILYLAAAGTVSPFTGWQKYNETPHKRLITAPLPCIVLATHTEIIKYNMWYNINDTCTWIYTNIYTCISTWMYTKWCVHNYTYIDTHKNLCIHSTSHYVHIHILCMNTCTNIKYRKKCTYMNMRQYTWIQQMKLYTLYIIEQNYIYLKVMYITYRI